MIVVLIPTLYALGWFVTTILVARNWFRRFDVELSGVVWAMMVALFWPLLLPAYAIKAVASRGL